MEKALTVVEQKEVIFYDDELTTVQASDGQISQAVKTVAMKLSEIIGANEYGGVYGELYRRFEMTRYKLLPASKFDKAMEFLTDWHNRVTKK